MANSHKKIATDFSVAIFFVVRFVLVFSLYNLKI